MLKFITLTLTYILCDTGISGQDWVTVVDY